MTKPATHPRKKAKKTVVDGIAHIHMSLNDTIVTIADRRGNALSWVIPSGSSFRDSRKSTPLATQVTAECTGQAALEYDLKDLDINVRGLGPGRESVVHALSTCGYKIANITDVAPISHNGCCPSKKRCVQQETVRNGSLHWSQMQTASS